MMSGVGGVEPETVILRLWEHEQSGLLTQHDPLDRVAGLQWQEFGKFVPLSALRLVEEELRQAREERDRASTLSTGWAAESGRWEARYNEAVADRDRLAEALREIADQDWVENVLDPQRAARIAVAALSPVQGEHHAQPEGENQMDDNNLNHLIAVNVLVPRLSVCEAERDEARRERDAYRKSWEREAQDAARYRLHHEACVTQRDEARKAAAGWVEDVSTMAARVDDMAGDLRACRAALDWYAKEDRYDVGRASSRPVVLADRGLLARRALAALSPVQGEHEQDGDTA